MQWSKDSLFNKWCWENWTGTCKKNETRPPLTPYTKINSKCIKDINVSHKIIKILEGNIGSNISDISCSNIFANIPPWARKTKEKINGTA